MAARGFFLFLGGFLGEREGGMDGRGPVNKTKGRSPFLADTLVLSNSVYTGRVRASTTQQQLDGVYREDKEALGEKREMERGWRGERVAGFSARARPQSRDFSPNTGARARAQGGHRSSACPRFRHAHATLTPLVLTPGGRREARGGGGRARAHGLLGPSATAKSGGRAFTPPPPRGPPGRRPCRWRPASAHGPLDRGLAGPCPGGAGSAL